MMPAGTVTMLHDAPGGEKVHLHAPQVLPGQKASPSALAPDPVPGRLIGEIYAFAPPAVRARLIEEMLRPMSPFALIGIPGAGGVFAQIRARNAEWQGFRVESGDVAGVQPREVTALVHWVLRARPAALRSLVAIVRESPALANCQAACALAALNGPLVEV